MPRGRDDRGRASAAGPLYARALPPSRTHHESGSALTFRDRGVSIVGTGAALYGRAGIGEAMAA
jgi:hypothetical protein